MSRRLFIGVFDNEADMIAAVRAARANGHRIVDVHTPYPVHGLDAAMGLAPSRLPWMVFGFGVAAAALKVWFEYWTTAVDWPVNVGGKPWNSLPAFVPVTFEVMVLFAGLSAVFGFFVVCKLFPGKRAVLPVVGVTDDRFAVILDEKDSQFDVSGMENLFRSLNAVDVQEQIAEVSR